MAGRGRTATKGPAGRAKKDRGESRFTVEDIPDFTPRTKTPEGRYQDQSGERPMAQRRVPNWYDGKSKASATVRSNQSADATRRQFENAFGSKATGGIKARNSNTGNVTEQKTEQKKPSWYSGKKTKAKATVRGKNG